MLNLLQNGAVEQPDTCERVVQMICALLQRRPEPEQEQNAMEERRAVDPYNRLILSHLFKDEYRLVGGCSHAELY
jgi:hypothetical protein